MFNLFSQDDQSTLQKELLKDYLNEGKIQKLIDSGLDINIKNSKGKHILFDLVDKRRIESIKILLQNGVDINMEDEQGNTPLAQAASNGDAMMIRFLLERKAKINYVNKSGRILIQDVALEGNFKIFKLLIAAGADLNYIDTYNRTILFDAIEGGRLDIVKIVLTSLKDVNHRDDEGETVLFHAALKDDQSVMKFLIKSGLDLNQKDNNGENVMFRVVLKGSTHLDTVDMLLARDIDLNTPNNKGITLLDEVMKIFNITREKDLDKYRQTRYRYVKKENDYLKLLTILIEHGLNINKLDEHGRTILFHEIHKKDFEAIDFLLNAGADINACDEDGKNLLFQECLKGYDNVDMIDFLFEKGIDIDHRDNEEMTIVDDLTEMVLVQESGKEPTNRRFMDVQENGQYFRLLKRMLLRRPKFNVPRNDGRTILFDLINYNNLELIKLFLNNGADANLADKEGNTPLSVMVEKGLQSKSQKAKDAFIERLIFFLKFRVDVDAQDKQGRTIFHKAVIADDYQLVEKLLTKKADLNIKDKQGRTVLHHTQWKGNFKIARLLISAGADMNEVDHAGFSILNYAAILGHAKLVMVLISSGVLMYNQARKSKKVAMFFKSKDENLNQLVENAGTDKKMRSALQQVADNLRKEVAIALRS